MRHLYEGLDDFEGLVRVLTEREGGRHTPPLNGIRWDLRYFFQGEDQLSMVWPEFLDEAGDPIPPDRPLSGLLRARFFIITDEMRGFHRLHARPGVGFFCVEGPKVCAAGMVTRVTGLAEKTVTSEV